MLKDTVSIFLVVIGGLFLFGLMAVVIAGLSYLILPNASEAARSGVGLLIALPVVALFIRVIWYLDHNE